MKNKILIITTVLLGLGLFLFNAQQYKNEKITIQKDNKDSEVILINTPAIRGEISLKGLRIKKIDLLRYKEDISDNSENVRLLSDDYFIQLGFLGNIEMPNSDTIWTVDNRQLTPNNPVSATWVNKNGVTFNIIISVDENYMISFANNIQNASGEQINFQYYGVVNKTQNDLEQGVVHQGPIAVIDNKLEESGYKNVKEDKKIIFRDQTLQWIGISDKYWLTAIIADQKYKYNSSFNYDKNDINHKYQVDFLSQKILLDNDQKWESIIRIFTGSKNVELLDNYEKQYNISLFDRAIDFGWFYIITKPIFNILNFFYKIFGNFGFSIVALTIIVKLAMFSLSNKTYRSMNKMKEIQPKIEKLKEVYKNDSTKLSQEIMQLYRSEKINPLSGFIPILIQIPIFFSIYKVLNVTIEMRHAHFFGWIKDLSAPDTLLLLNGFGMFDIYIPSYLQISFWSILMAVTMMIQQSMSPPPGDPAQAQVMKIMPWILLFMFSGLPVGLLIYWTLSNVLSILQQYFNKKTA